MPFCSVLCLATACQLKGTELSSCVYFLSSHYTCVCTKSLVSQTSLLSPPPVKHLTKMRELWENGCDIAVCHHYKIPTANTLKQTRSVSTEIPIFPWSLKDKIRLQYGQELCSHFKQTFLHIPAVAWQISAQTSDWVPQSTRTLGPCHRWTVLSSGPTPSIPQHHTQGET